MKIIYILVLIFNFDNALSRLTKQQFLNMRGNCRELSDTFRPRQGLELKNCFDSYINFTEINNGYSKHPVPDEKQMFSVLLSQFCPRKEKVLKCIRSYTLLSNVCATSSLVLKTRALVSTFKGFTEYVCRDNFKNTLEFIDNQGIVCIDKHSNGILNCLSDVIDSFVATDDFKISNLNLSSVRTCIVNYVDRFCSNSVISEFVDGLINEITNSL